MSSKTIEPTVTLKGDDWGDMPLWAVGFPDGSTVDVAAVDEADALARADAMHNPPPPPPPEPTLAEKVAQVLVDAPELSADTRSRLAGVLADTGVKP